MAGYQKCIIICDIICGCVSLSVKLHVFGVCCIKLEMAKRSFSARFKLEAIAFAGSSTNEAAARNFQVDAKRIREWRKRKRDLQDLLEDGQAKRKRFVGGRRPEISEDLEEILLDWIYEQRSKGIAILGEW